jgi:hypothetical protein
MLELRIVKKVDEDTTRSYLKLIRNAYYTVRREHPEFRVRIIGASGKNEKYTLDTTFDTLQMFIRLSRELRDEFDPEQPQDFIIGLDLVNEEDNSKPLDLYVDYLRSEKVKQSGLKLYLHCGESLRLSNTSVRDAYAAGTYRAGHAFNLFRFPDTLEKYKERGITVEVCPISNQALEYVEDLRGHPATEYLKRGLPISICSSFTRQMPTRAGSDMPPFSAAQALNRHASFSSAPSASMNTAKWSWPNRAQLSLLNSAASMCPNAWISRSPPAKPHLLLKAFMPHRSM